MPTSSNDPKPIDSKAKIDSKADTSSWLSASFSPFRKATLRGLGVILPPLLTIVFFIWVWGILDSYVLKPVDSIMSTAVSWSVQDIRTDEEIQKQIKKHLSSSPNSTLDTTNDRKVFTATDGVALAKIRSKWIPLSVVKLVDESPGSRELLTANDYYLRFVQINYLKRHLVIPAFIAAFIAILYLLGKLLAARLGLMLWHAFESIVNQLPIIRNVYSSVKQVTDFAFNETEFTFNRVVAVEYPRKGVWSMGFVTGESFPEIKAAAGEPVLTVLMPTSPMPATGFTISVPKSETIDLNITIDQAIQFCVSCGVVIPSRGTNNSMIEGEIQRRVSQATLAGEAEFDSTA